MKVKKYKVINLIIIFKAKCINNLSYFVPEIDILQVFHKML